VTRLPSPDAASQIRSAGSDGERAFETLCRQLGWPEPVREFQFVENRKWRADFAWPSLMVLVEIEGAAWTQGRHTRGGGFEADLVKANEAQLLGYRVFRFSTEQVIDGTAASVIGRALG
jgi:very-short-patch-repair endonuclease